MTVRTPDDFVGAGNFFAHVGKHPAEFLRDRVAGGVRQIDHDGAGANHLAANVDHIVPVGTRSVLARELDVVEMLFCARDGPGGGVEHVFAIHVEFVFEMDFRGRDENVNPRMRGLVDCAQRRIDILFAGAREAEHDGFGQRLSDPIHGLEVAGRRSGESGLDDIDVEPFELARERDLLLDVHRASGRLLAVAQRRVEDSDVVGVLRARVRVCHRHSSRIVAAGSAGRSFAMSGKRKRPGRLRSAHCPGRVSQFNQAVRPARTRAWRGPL